jgi:hypothetical protein
MTTTCHFVAPRERGGAMLAVVCLLVLAVMLTLGFAQGSLLFEHRATANQYRAAQAFEAAEAGIDWALAQLNSAVPLDAACRASGAESATPFGERFLAGPDARGRWSVRGNASTGQVLQASCTPSSAGFSCLCPGDVADTDLGIRQRFSIHFEVSDASEQVQLLSSGCSGNAADCASGQADTAFLAHTRVTLARLPSLGGMPTAALTVRGTVDLPDAPFELSHRTRDSGGLTLHSGGAVHAPRLSLHSVPGAPAGASVIAHDAALERLDAAGFFAGLFGMSELQWQQQPDVRRIDCSSPCDAALRQALGHRVAHPRVWLAGGLHLVDAQTLGSAQTPVLLVVDGPVRFDAPVQIHGLVHAKSATWSDFGGAQVQGAVSVEAGLAGQGATRIAHDAAVLKRLRERSGTWARVPGSWSDDR